MNRFLRLTAALTLVFALSSCAGNNDVTPGLLIPDETTADPNATIVTAPGADVTENASDAPDDTGIIPPAPTETRISFLAAGDNIIHENVFLDARSRAKEGQEYNFTDMYAGIADAVKDADIAFINQETPICGDEMTVSGYPNFNTPEAAGDTLIELGFDIINIANNHMLDKREAGYKGTLNYWDARADKVTLLGGYRDKADYENIRVIEEQGVSIAFVTYTYSTNGMYLPTGSNMFVPYIDSAEIVRMTQKAGELADLVFVVMHWGNEDNSTPTSEQKSLASAITEAGADVIIGMHPHVIQPMEWLTASDGTQTLVIYSLGNLICTQYNSYNLVGGIVTFDIVKSLSGELTIENPIYNPTVCHYNTQRLGLQVYFMEDYTEELVALHGCPGYGQNTKGRTWTLDYIRGLVTNSITEEFLPDFLK